jgi:LmbE family N-acetylglucosaminyl deacetylase
MKILAIGAHADDCEIAMGGTLANFVKQKYKVKIVIMSQSASINYDGKMLRSAQQTQEEEKNALKILGISDYTFLNFPNKDVPYNSISVETLNRIIDDFNPNLIFTHWIFDTHQSHRNTGLAVVSAARNYNNILFFEPFPPSGRSYLPFKTQFYSDITDTIEQKLNSLKKHKSQYIKYGDEWIEATKARAKLRGFECQKKYAECFEILRMECRI